MGTKRRRKSAAVTAPAARTAERAGTAPSYGPWSSYFYDLRARASAPTKKRKRAHVQVERNANASGDRQLQLRWRPAGRATAREPDGDGVWGRSPHRRAA